MSDISPNAVAELVGLVAERLQSKHLIMSTAESCTGGWISQALTALPGSSDWFDCGFVTYSNSAKTRLLSVPESLFDLAGPGAVSEAVVLAMTRGALANSQADVAVAVSGIAGPDGGSREKPVGTVWIAWRWHEKALARRFQFTGDRQEVRLATVVAALEGILALID